MEKQEPKEKIIKEGRDFKGIWIPKHIYLNQELNWTEKILLIEINSLTFPDKDCFASNAYFAEFLGVSERIITKSITKLKKLGFIIQTDFTGRRRLLRGCLEQKFQADPNQSSRQDGTLVPDRPEPKFQHNNIDNNTDNKTSNIISSTDSKKQKKDSLKKEIESWFNEQFWPLYPTRNGKRLNKKQALNWCLKNLNGNANKIMIAVRNYANSQTVNDGYARDAIRWLRNEEWQEWLTPETIKNKSGFNQAAQPIQHQEPRKYRTSLDLISEMENQTEPNLDEIEIDF